MRRYETVFIFDPDLTETDRDQISEKNQGIVSKYTGEILDTEDWGVKKLAYGIRKKSRGHYVRMDYCGDGDLVAELERSCRIDDRVLKFMTIVVDKDVDLEAVKAEMAQSKAASETTAEAPEGETAAEETAAE